jgi:hypothetical protein
MQNQNAERERLTDTVRMLTEKGVSFRPQLESALQVYLFLIVKLFLWIKAAWNCHYHRRRHPHNIFLPQTQVNKNNL